MPRLLIPLLVALSLSACERPVGVTEDTVEISGTVTYRERIALPPDAVLEIRIQDRAGDVLADTSFQPRAQVPITFAVEIPTARIDTSRAYALSARLEASEGRMAWETPSPEMVLTQGAPRQVDLVLQAERRPQAPAADPWRHARERGVGFRAMGQEPDWMMDVHGTIVTPTRVVLTVGEEAYQFDQVIRDEDGEGNLRYRASAAERRFEAVIEDRLCHDVLTGEEFEALVSVRWNDSTFEGCGRGLN